MYISCDSQFRWCHAQPPVLYTTRISCNNVRGLPKVAQVQYHIPYPWTLQSSPIKTADIFAWLSRSRQHISTNRKGGSFYHLDLFNDANTALCRCINSGPSLHGHNVGFKPLDYTDFMRRPFKCTYHVTLNFGGVMCSHRFCIRLGFSVTMFVVSLK